MNTVKQTGIGRNTLSGKIFERKTNSSDFLISKGFVKRMLGDTKHFLYMKRMENKTIVYLYQKNFRYFCKDILELDVWRDPDEAFVILFTESDKISLGIIETKNQSVPGSVDQKLYNASYFKDEYEHVFRKRYDTVVDYAFCLSPYFKDLLDKPSDKWAFFKKHAQEHNIQLMFGEDDTYHATLWDWVQKL